ncbi:MAG TPA: NAD(P)-binding domain-containing protein [Methylomirabilota bacterium]|nr:NAD(P)-binding domain-containing protein [Methylomirabilota bacterium]
MHTIGFIGLGSMGRPMATNVVKAGFALRVHDIVPDAVAALVARGAEARPSPKDVAGDVDAVITMLPDSPDVEAVLLGPEGVIQGARPGTFVIDMSTIDPTVTRRVGAALEARGLRFLDAPVGRTSAHAEAGTLYIMVGGDPADLAAVEPLLRAMGSDVVHCGSVGTGITMKVVNNYLSCAASVLTAECLVLGAKAGLELETMLRVMTNTAAKTAHLEMTYPAKAFRGDFTPGFAIDLAHKDLGIGLRLGAEQRVPLTMGAVAREVYSAARAEGKGQLDYSGIITLLEEMAGVKVRRR